MVWLWQSDESITNLSELARRVGMEASWVRRMMLRYSRQGAAGLRDRRKDNGRELFLSDEDIRDLEEALSKEPEDGGMWNSAKVAGWMSERLKRPVGAEVGWHYLKRLSMSLQVPRPRHHQSASDKQKQAYKKTGLRPQKVTQKTSG
jgi:transposase